MSRCEKDFNNCSYFKAEIRTQITILADSDTICYLLKEIHDNCINLDGYYYQNIECDSNIFTFVVGNENEQSSSDLRTVQCILKKWCIDYLENDTVRVIINHNTPGALAKIYCALAKCLDVYSSYYAQRKGIYIETSNNCKAVKIINSLN